MSNVFDPITYVVNLPPLNGEYEAGLSASGDLSIPESDRLSVFSRHKVSGGIRDEKTATVLQAFESAAWAMRKTEFSASAMADWYIKGAFSAVLLGLVGKITKGTTQVYDGDFVLQRGHINPPINEEEADKIRRVCISDNFSRALSIQVAGKANFYQTNHHTGESMTKASGYMLKCLRAIVEKDSGDVVKMAHTISHWCSTVNMLKKAGVPNMRTDFVTSIPHALEFTLTNDAALRFDSYPAGTAKFAVSLGGITRLKGHELLKYFQNPEALIEVANEARRLRNLGALAHVGASYLTGGRREVYTDALTQTVMGRLGYFLRTFYQHSTLVKSPHYLESRVTSYDDYSPPWVNLCNAWLRIGRSQLENVVPEEQATLTQQQLAELRERLN